VEKERESMKKFGPLQRVSPALIFVFSFMILLIAGCGTKPQQETSQSPRNPEKPVIIQGAMPIEAEKLANRLENVQTEKSGNFVFYKGTLNQYPVIVVKTGKGMENTAAATALAIEKYQPVAIINQGTSGGHDPGLHVFDIVLGKRVTHIGSFKTTDKEEGEGTDPSTWKPMDLMASEGSAGEDKNAEKIRYYEGDPELLKAALAVKNQYKNGKVVEGTIGSADLWNNEVDRIRWYHEKYGTSVEEMEGASAAQIADAYGVPFLGIRILSNNKTNAGKYNPDTAEACQEYVYHVVNEYISTLKNK
jgi:adenosylhomocysteine nucleosidase